MHRFRQFLRGGWPAIAEGGVLGVLLGAYLFFYVIRYLRELAPDWYLLLGLYLLILPLVWHLGKRVRDSYKDLP
jgi:hypothetical protein